VVHLHRDKLRCAEWRVYCKFLQGDEHDFAEVRGCSGNSAKPAEHWTYIRIMQPTRCTCYLKLFILVKRTACFRRSFRPSSGAQNCIYSNSICQTAAAIGDEMSSISSAIATGGSSCLTYTVAVYAVLSSWWWMERPSEIWRAFYKNK
jgi:hypothetical protein